MSDENPADPSSDARAERAARRRQAMVLRKTTLDAGEEDLSPVFGEAAISLLTKLSRESFSLASLETPGYARHEIPCVFVPGRLT